MNRMILATLMLILVGRMAVGESSTNDVSVVVRSTDESALPRIQIDFEVTRADGSPLLDATKDDFRVMEYDAECPTVPYQVTETTQTRTASY